MMMMMMMMMMIQRQDDKKYFLHKNTRVFTQRRVTHAYIHTQNTRFYLAPLTVIYPKDAMQVFRLHTPVQTRPRQVMYRYDFSLFFPRT